MFVSPDVPPVNGLNQKGASADLSVLVEDAWLVNTEVRYRLVNRQGLWHLTMVYVAVENPLQLLCRKIDRYHSEKKALLFARLLQRGIRKDARGTLKTRRDAFNLCDN